MSDRKKGTKIYFVEHLMTCADLKIKIDFDKMVHYSGDKYITVEEAIKEMVEFWSGHKDRIQENDGDYIKTFLKQVLQNLIPLIVDGSLRHELISYFTQDHIEGWWPLDGSAGIEIISSGTVEYDDQNEYEVKELT